MNNKFFAAALIAASVAFTAGCASTGNPTVSASPSATPTATFDAMTPAQAKAAYKVIAKASCNEAELNGVVETVGPTTVVMTPKSKGYKDYNAAYFTKPDKYEVIWELTGLASCADWYTFSMSDEAGKEADIDVTFNKSDGTYEVTQSFDDVKYAYQVTAVDGKISSMVEIKTGAKTTLKYGNQTAADQLILTTAVDRYLATIG